MFWMRFYSKKDMIGASRGWQAVSVGELFRLKFKTVKDTRRDVGINWILPKLARYRRADWIAGMMWRGENTINEYIRPLCYNLVRFTISRSK